MQHDDPRSRPIGPLVATLVLLAAVAAGATWSQGTPTPEPAPRVERAAAVVATSTTPGATEPITFTWVGDMMIGSTTPTAELPPNGGRNTFDDVRDLLAADVTMGNLEGPLTDAGPTDKCDGRTDCYTFSQPPGYAAVYKDAGFDILNLANNHVMDRGTEGVAATQRALDGAGIAHTGLPDTAARVEVKGATITALGFSHYRGTAPSTDLAAVEAAVEEAEASSDIVIVLFHGGLEGPAGVHVSRTSDPGVDVISFAHTAAEAGADLVLGSGPHVLRGIEFHEGALIAYSLGNFATYAKFNLDQDEMMRSAVLAVTLEPDGSFASGAVKPVKLVGEGTPTPGGRAISFVRDLSTADFGESAAVIGDDGSITPPPA